MQFVAKEGEKKRVFSGSSTSSEDENWSIQFKNAENYCFFDFEDAKSRSSVGSERKCLMFSSDEE